MQQSFPTDPTSVGIPTLDADHLYLISLLNRLSTIDAHSVRATIEEVLDRLTIFCHLHFEREERVFAANLTPIDPRHRSDHLNLVRFLSETRKELNGDTASVDHAHAIFDYILAWVTQHVADHDFSLRRITNVARAEAVARASAPPFEYLMDSR